MFHLHSYLALLIIAGLVLAITVLLITYVIWKYVNRKNGLINQKYALLETVDDEIDIGTRNNSSCGLEKNINYRTMPIQQPFSEHEIYGSLSKQETKTRALTYDNARDFHLPKDKWMEHYKERTRSSCSISNTYLPQQQMTPLGLGMNKKHLSRTNIFCSSSYESLPEAEKINFHRKAGKRVSEGVFEHLVKQGRKVSATDLRSNPAKTLDMTPDYKFQNEFNENNFVRKTSRSSSISANVHDSTEQAFLSEDSFHFSKAIGIKRRLAGRRLDRQHHTSSLSKEYSKSFRKTGNISFTTEYKNYEEKLIVSIKTVSISSSSKQNESDLNPYVKLYLNPGKRQKQQTTIKKGTRKPCYDEDLVLKLCTDDLLRNMLVLKVLHYNNIKKKDDLGEVMIALSSIDINAKETFNTELFLQRTETAFTSVQISLCHKAASSVLEVTINQVKNLPKQNLLGCYVSVLLFKENSIYKKETSIKRNTRDPIFNESLSFEIFTDIHSPINSYKLVVTVNGKTMIGKNDVIGHIIFCRTSPQKSAVEQWSLVEDVPYQTHMLWHSLVSPDELP